MVRPGMDGIYNDWTRNGES
ncbi:hypothetical protein ACEPAI_1486 [Sanghuangporus weigelae]